MTNNLKVLFLSAEAEPFVKIGGLADVAGALPQALTALPEKPDIRLVLPFYPRIKRKQLTVEAVASFQIPHENGPIQADVVLTWQGGLPVYLIGGTPVEETELIYSSDVFADGHKFTFFSLAALELCKILDWQPDLIHAQDWHTACAVYAIKTRYADDSFYQDMPTLLTVHNLPYLGNGAGPALKAFGLSPATESNLPWWAQDMPLPLGLLKADKINTVSTGYADEMLTPEFGSGLEEFLQSRSDDLLGILNGLDQHSWNPQTDTRLTENFNIKKLHRRKSNKSSLQKELNLPEEPNVPLLAFIGRMDHQKGVEIALNALKFIQHMDWQAVILGTGNPELENQAKRFESEMPDRLRALIRFDGDLARRIYGGADIMMIPSRYEPCGLIQMIAMRYGCVPVARATGGLKDTITDYGESNSSTGFLFEQADPVEMAAALERALVTYKDKRRWPHLQKRGMSKDFSWKKSAAQYFQLYQSLVEKKLSEKNPR
ncbi:MAG: glycosyltransferase [candidate division Zixibacteria bacterium]|nr:glycosyltransferase [Gammaproteobacteria bacterium]NIX57278.1 glycosyltransferase [candidate division Zixibacteria bacterium]